MEKGQKVPLFHRKRSKSKRNEFGMECQIQKKAGKEFASKRGGKIQAMYPAEDIALVFNNSPNGPLLPQNRSVRNDIVRGNFFLCGAPEDGNRFVSLTVEQLRHYAETFALPEVFLDLGIRTIILPCRESWNVDKKAV